MNVGMYGDVKGRRRNVGNYAKKLPAQILEAQSAVHGPCRSHFCQATIGGGTLPHSYSGPPSLWVYGSPEGTMFLVTGRLRIGRDL